MTISAVTLAALQARDGSALAAALEVGGVFYPVINFFLQFWENIAAARAREAARTRNTSPFVNDSENGEAGEQGDPSPRRTA